MSKTVCSYWIMGRCKFSDRHCRNLHKNEESDFKRTKPDAFSRSVYLQPPSKALVGPTYTGSVGEFPPQVQGQPMMMKVGPGQQIVWGGQTDQGNKSGLCKCDKFGKRILGWVEDDLYSTLYSVYSAYSIVCTVSTVYFTHRCAQL